MSVFAALAILLLIACVMVMAFAYAWFHARDQRSTLSTHLQASESQYRQLLGVADLAIAILDEACHVVDWNPVLERLYGRTRRDMLGQQFFLACAPGREAAALSARMMAMRSSDAVLEFTFVVETQDEGERQLRWRARHFTDVRDGRRYLSLVGHDVTDVESMQRWLADSEARFRLMFEAVPAALALLDGDGRMLMVNPACAHFFGYDAPEQMVMLNIQELVHQDDRQASMAALANVLSQPGTLYQMEKRYVRREGDMRWGHMRCRPLSLAPGQTFLLAKISDVHERKQTELALVESERRLGSLIANLAGVVYRYELPASRRGLHHDRAADFLSDGTHLLTGQSQGPFALGDSPRTIGELVFDDDRQRVQSALDAAMKGGGRFEVSYRLHHGPSGMRWVLESGRVWQREDGSWTVDGHINDVSAERHAREAEQVLRSLLGEASAGYVSLSLDGRVLDANMPFCRMAGVDAPEQLLGRSLEAFMPAGREGVLRRFLEKVVREGVLRDMAFTLPRQDGAEMSLRVNAVAVEQAGQSSIRCLVLDMIRVPVSFTAAGESDTLPERMLAEEDDLA